jgi:acetyl esterase
MNDCFKTHPATQPVPLDAELRAVLETLPKQLYLLPLEQFRATMERQVAETPKLNLPVAKIEDREIAGPGGPIRLRIYTPQGSGPWPLLLHYHGGGWVLGTLDTHDDVCRSLCSLSGSVVVSVDYRRAPEHKHPAAVEDCWTALQWTAESAAAIGGDPNRMGVIGDSAGGNLAAAVALCCRDRKGPRLALQVLIYPVTNYDFDTASYHENADDYGLTRDAMIFFWESYLATSAQGTEPYASPLRAGDLSGLPPALILTAQFDPLRDDGEAYAARLRRAGVPVRLTRYLDMNHGFFMAAAMFDSAHCALQEVADALKEALRR